jgi:tRNA threonylcarbamoyladenosine biosynthesis protein TsaB
MRILALDFSSEQRSVAVAEGDTAVRVLAERAVRGERSAPALGLIEAVLRDAGLRRADIDVLAIGLGPGSYTGIRIAIALAQGWQLAQGVKLLGLSSAGALARRAAQEGLRGRVWIAIDAQRGEFYLASYEVAGPEPREIEPLHLAPRAELDRLVADSEALVSPEAARLGPGVRPLFPHASDLAQLAAGRTDFVSGEQLEPIYLRETAFVKAPPPRIVS